MKKLIILFSLVTVSCVNLEDFVVDQVGLEGLRTELPNSNIEEASEVTSLVFLRHGWLLKNQYRYAMMFRKSRIDGFSEVIECQFWRSYGKTNIKCGERGNRENGLGAGGDITNQSYIDIVTKPESGENDTVKSKAPKILMPLVDEIKIYLKEIKSEYQKREILN